MTLQVLIKAGEKSLHIECEGQIDLPKQPPFDFATPGPAALVTIELGEHAGRLPALFDHWYMTGGTARVLAWDGKITILATMRCVEMDWSRGLQVTRSWSEPLRRASVDGQAALYRPTPRHQLTRGTTNRYVLAAASWQQVAVPEQFKKRSGVVEVWN